MADTVRGDLRLRFLTALIMAPLALTAVYLGGIAFMALVAVAALAMAWEWDRLWPRRERRVTTPLIQLLVVAAVLLTGSGLVGVALLLLLGGAAVLALLAGRLRAPGGWWALAPLYVGVPCTAFVWLRHWEDGGWLVIVWLLLVVWASDVGGYVFGRMIGGPKLAPRISPKKTWAGFVGGVVCAVLVGAVVAGVAGTAAFGILALAAASVAVAAQCGDLLESALKRRRGVKDTGGLIPGHGGVLDRVDGLLAGACLLALASAVGGENVLAWQ